MKFYKKLLAGLLFLFLVIPGDASATVPTQMGATQGAYSGTTELERIRKVLTRWRLPAEVQTTNYVLDQIVNQNPAEYEILFNEGAAKGMFLRLFSGVAAAATAANQNHVFFGPIGAKMTNVAATGAALPTMDATGLDIGGGTITSADNSAWEWSQPDLGLGRPFLVGTDPAFYMCTTVTVTDVSGTSLFFMGFRTMNTPVALASYTDYCGIHLNAGDIFNSDKTTGATDTTDNWADLASKTICTYVSAGGACTYTINGVAPTVADAHTLGDGILVEPAWQILHSADLAEDTLVTELEVGFQ